MDEKLTIHDFLSVDEQKLLIELVPDEIILVTPADQHIVYSNHAPPGMTLEQMIGQPYLSLGSASGRQVMEDALQAVINQWTILERETELVIAGESCWTLIRMIPVIRDQRLHYILITHTSIKALKDAIIALQLSRQRLQDQLEKTPLAAMMWDADGITVEWNPAAERVFGYSREEAVGKHFIDLIVPFEEREARKEHFAHALTTGEIIRMSPYGNATKDGRVIICEWFSTTLRNVQGEVTGIASFARDVTVKQQAEKELEAAKQAAEASAMAKAHFLANMSHEIRTPMNGILGMIELMKREQLTDAQQEKLNIIHYSTQNLLAILNDILDFSKIDSNAVEIEHISMDVNKLLQQIVDLMRPATEKKKLQFSYKLLPEQYRYIKGDPNRLTQILSNLISNAIKFTEHGGVRIEAHAEAVDYDQIAVLFDVIDTGIGIKKEELDSIFDAFSQADASITRRYGGTGLGLTICQRLASLMNGTINVKSSYRRGSRFQLRLLTELATSLPPPVEAVDETPMRFSNKKVLLVDDNDVNLKVGAKMLEIIGLNVECANNGEQALQKLALHPDTAIVLMDIHMPEMNGFEAAQCIRNLQAAYAQVPIIAVTANVLETEKQQCLAVGMNDFLAKPFSLSLLSNMLAKWL